MAAEAIRFATDAALGKLGRSMRAAGFDTLCQHQCRDKDFFETLEADRVILTRTRAVARRFQDRRLIFIRDNDARQQLTQVIRTLELECDCVYYLSRCLECNLKIAPVSKNAVKGRIPEYVWQHHHHFQMCRSCKRIYWAGSHHQRMTRQLENLFKQKDDS
jgi:uncharacterized protein with PIN domain